MSSDHHFRQAIVRRAFWVVLIAISVAGFRSARTVGPSTGTSSANLSAQQSNTAGASSARIRTDRRVYPEPLPPVLPRAGGKFNDPVFGTQIMRATDEKDYPAPGCGTWYSQWPSFNSDNTRLLIRCGVSGDMKIKAFDPVSFTLGATLRTAPTIPNGQSLQWQGATWSRTDPDLIFVHASYYDRNYPALSGMKLYTYRPSTNVVTLIKDFTSLSPW